MDRAASFPHRDAPRYRRLAAIASGGMGTVDLCLRIEGEFQRLVAVKRLLPLLRVDESVREMFLDEARIAGLLRHPNVVSVTDVGEDEDGPFLVMDYVEGLSLHAMRGLLGARMPAGIAARIVLDCARGLHAAHELRGLDGTWLGLVHRDVSPHNVLVGFDGRVLLTDFGISKAVGRQTRTSTGVIKGKLGYMAPEQLRFEDAERRSDIFALGIVLQELLTGARLFEGEPRVVAQNILNGKIPRLSELRPDVPEALAALTTRMLATRVDARPSTADEVAETLEAILRTGDVALGPTNVAEFVASELAAERTRRSEEIARAIALKDAPREPAAIATDPSISREREVDPSPPPPQDRTAAATPRSMEARRWRRPAVAWTIAACFVLTPIVMWAIDLAQTRDDVAVRPAPAPVEARAEDAIPPADAPPEHAIEQDTTPDGPVAEPAPAPRRARDRARPRREDDPMGRWSWE